MDHLDPDPGSPGTWHLDPDQDGKLNKYKEKRKK
jgi:hypothetical protein